MRPAGPPWSAPPDPVGRWGQGSPGCRGILGRYGQWWWGVGTVKGMTASLLCRGVKVVWLSDQLTALSVGGWVAAAQWGRAAEKSSRQ